MLLTRADEKFKPGTTFDNVLDLYRFDKKLMVILFNEIENNGLPILLGERTIMEIKAQRKK